MSVDIDRCQLKFEKDVRAHVKHTVPCGEWATHWYQDVRTYQILARCDKHAVYDGLPDDFISVSWDEAVMYLVMSS